MLAVGHDDVVLLVDGQVLRVLAQNFPEFGVTLIQSLELFFNFTDRLLLLLFFGRLGGLDLGVGGVKDVVVALLCLGLLFDLWDLIKVVFEWIISEEPFTILLRLWCWFVFFLGILWLSLGLASDRPKLSLIYLLQQRQHLHS